MTMNQNETASLATKSAELAEFSEPGRGRRLVVFGAGYVGGALARRALAQGWRVTTLTRNPDTAAELRAAGAEVVVAELASEAWWGAPELAGGAERVAVTVAAGGGGAEGYRRSYVEGLRSVLGWGKWLGAGSGWQRAGRLGRLVYTSSTSVYPQDGGVRVTEADAAGGEAETTRALIEAERIAGEWAAATGAGATVLRLAGIYGPGRVHLVEQVRSGEVSGRADSHLNLVYRDDILGAMEAAWERGAGGGERGAEVFNVADEGAATKGEIVAWLAERLGVAMPCFTGLPAGGRRMVTPDRVIDAGKARAVLGWRPRWRTFREGYAEVLRSSGW
jgi:nucleoside-diphosphate-sugar epimerase